MGNGADCLPSFEKKKKEKNNESKHLLIRDDKIVNNIELEYIL